MSSIGIRPNEYNKNYAYKKNNLLKIILIFISFVIAVFCIYLLAKYAFKPKNVISKNVYIENINLAGKNKEEAINTLNSSFKYLENEKANFKIADSSFTLTAKELEYSLGIEKSVDEALNLSKENKYKALKEKKYLFIEEKYNKDKFEIYLDEILKLIPESQMPKERFIIEDGNLVIYKGEDPVKITRDELKKIILKKFKSPNFKQVETIPLVSLNQKIDFDEIYKEVEKDAKNAYIDENGKIVNEESGIQISLTKSEAKKLFENSEEKCIIPIKILEPSIKASDLLKEDFKDLLAETTLNTEGFNLNEKREILNKIQNFNNITIKNNTIFSYNKILNQNKYQTDSFIATAIYQAVLQINMDVRNIHKNKYLPFFCKNGLDAFVSSDKDFSFRNNQMSPIKINIEGNLNQVNVKIYGEKKGVNSSVKFYSSELETIPMVKKEEKNFHYEIGYENIKQKGSDGKKIEVTKEIFVNGKSNGKIPFGVFTYEMKPEIKEVGNKPTNQGRNQETNRENRNNENNNN